MRSVIIAVAVGAYPGGAYVDCAADGTVRVVAYFAGGVATTAVSLESIVFATF